MTKTEQTEQNMEILHVQIPLKLRKATIKGAWEGHPIQHLALWIQNDEINFEQKGTAVILEIATESLFSNEPKYRIINIDCNKETKDNIETTIIKYNEKYGFTPPKFEEIIRKNLQLMTSIEQNGMRKLFGSESLGGNAGEDCWAANFRYDESNGEIIIFANIQDISKDIIKKTAGGTFRLQLYPDKMNVAMKMNEITTKKMKEGLSLDEISELPEMKQLIKQDKIIEVFFDRKPTKTAEQIIRATIEEYNKKCKW